MIWDDIGFLLSKNKYNENSVIAEFYTLNHGKCSGIIYGGTSRKIKNYLQLGNKVFITFKSKNENKNGYFTIEIIEPISPLFFDNILKMSIITSSVNLLHILTPELQKNEKVFYLLSNLFDHLKKKDENIILQYIFWELDLLKLLGYDLELENLVEKNLEDSKTVYFANSQNEKKYVPNFLIEKNLVVSDINILLSGLKLVGDFLDKTILKPNNINHPNSRIIFINSLK